MLASELITRALREINVPGRGATLSGDDQTAAFESLQDFLNSKAASRFAVPGIRRHFFALTLSDHIYSYGPGLELDTDDFQDPAPIRVEDAYIRAGAAITSNEQVTSWNFTAATGWTVGAGWTIANSKATADAAGSLTQPLALAAGTLYTVIVNVVQRAGDVVLTINQDGSPILTQTLDGSGTYTYEITFAGTTSDIDFTTDDADDDLDILDISIIETGLDRVSLSDGSDHRLRKLDQHSYNRRFSKGVGGRPYGMLFSRQGGGRAEIRFDHAPLSGDILVADVIVNTIAPAKITSTLTLNDEALRWLKYALADEVSGQYGKELRRGQISSMDDAYGDMVATNARPNKLRVDSGLRRGRGFDIDRGDP